MSNVNNGKLSTSQRAFALFHPALRSGNKITPVITGVNTIRALNF